MNDPRVYLWHDVSPDDGCTLAQFALCTTSLKEVALAVQRVPHLQNDTVKKLLRQGRARKAEVDEQQPAASTPGQLLWRTDGAWNAV
jgi:hypothetical protein